MYCILFGHKASWKWIHTTFSPCATKQKNSLDNSEWCSVTFEDKNMIWWNVTMLPDLVKWSLPVHEVFSVLYCQNKTCPHSQRRNLANCPYSARWNDCFCPSDLFFSLERANPFWILFILASQRVRQEVTTQLDRKWVSNNISQRPVEIQYFYSSSIEVSSIPELKC